MKKTKEFIILCLLLAATSLIAQDMPQAINFQAIARDANNEVLANTDIMIQLTILDGSADGPQVYREIRSLTTNAYGSFSFQIGRNPYMANGVFSEIDWAGGHKFLKIDYDPTATLSFNLSLGTIEFVSVPYAFAAGSVTFIDATGASNGDVLTYNAETGRFEPKPVSIPDWASQPTKPTYNYSEIGNTPDLSIYLTHSDIQSLENILLHNNSAGGSTISSLPSPIEAGDAVNKAYFDSIVNELRIIVSNAGGLFNAANGNLNGQHNGHDYVDLGLPSGNLWATCNIGATLPSDSGYYFAWGETEPKEEYTPDTYVFYDGANYTKYNETDGLTVLEETDDAAAVIWGNGWKMPTKDDFSELCQYCMVKVTCDNSVCGLLFIASNGNSIFLPYTGNINGQAIIDSECVNPHYLTAYRSSSVTPSGSYDSGYSCYGLQIERSAYSSILRYSGYSIRPVFTPQK